VGHRTRKIRQRSWLNGESISFWNIRQDSELRALKWFDANDVCSNIGQYHATESSGSYPRQLHDFGSVEQSHQSSPLFHFPPHQQRSGSEDL
jgi:hypothetical protein